MTQGAPLIETRALAKIFAAPRRLFATPRPAVRAVDGIDLRIMPGETLGLVGESGCGKSTAGRLVLRLLAPTGGQIFHRGEDITRLGGAGLRRHRRGMQIIFQDPFGSLNPRMRVGALVAEGLAIHALGSAAERTAKVARALERVGLPGNAAQRYPHEFSGGQRQRIGIARALVLEPEFIVADEVVSALDVSVQAQIINLMADLQRDLGLTYLFISHNLAVVRHISTRVAVMYLGRIVEEAPVDALFATPRHPYTRSLIDALPAEHPRQRRTHAPLAGDPPSPAQTYSGCRFAARCAHAVRKCLEEDPPFAAVGEGHLAACWRAEELRAPPHENEGA